MIGSGVFDRHPKLQVLIIHMGGELASVLGRLEFTWRLNYKGIRNPPAGRPCKNERPPSDYFKTNILVDCMASTQLDCKPPLRCAVRTEWCSAPITVRSHTGSKSMCRSSRTCFRARLSANRCSGNKQQGIPSGPIRYRSHHPSNLPSRGWFSACALNDRDRIAGPSREVICDQRPATFLARCDHPVIHSPDE